MTELLLNNSIFYDYTENKKNKECDIFREFLENEMGLYYIFETNEDGDLKLDGLEVKDNQKWMLAKIKYGI